MRIGDGPPIFTKLINLFKMPLEILVRLWGGFFVHLNGVIDFTRKGCVEFLFLYFTPNFFERATGAVPK